MFEHAGYVIRGVQYEAGWWVFDLLDCWARLLRSRDSTEAQVQLQIFAHLVSNLSSFCGD